mgnify:CR=1 FL=1
MTRMFTSDVLQKVKTDIESWTINFVEASNDFYGGKFPVCPYARQARVKGETTYAIYPGGNFKQFIIESINQLLADNKLKQMLIVMPPRAKWIFGIDRLINNINKRIIPLNYFALKGSANGAKSSYPGLSGEYQLIGLNTLDKVLEGVEYLEKKGYYKNWSEEHYSDIVIRRQQMHDKYGKQNIKAFYDRINFPGKYDSSDIVEYYNGNRYLNFIEKYIKSAETVLDAGCGTGFITNNFAYRNPDMQFTSVDFAKSIDWAQEVSTKLGLKNINFIKDDLNDFKSQDTYRVVLCQGVLHHIPNYAEVLKNLQSMVSKHGLFIIGLYHPWGKRLQKLLPTQYDSKVLEEDQEDNPFETSFTKKQVVDMFDGYQLIDSHPSAFFNWRNGGLTVYIFRKV